MEPNTIFTQFNKKLNEAFEHFREELAKLRTGRAHPGMLDSIKVEAYGVDMPLKQVGSISTPDAQLLQITPFDPGNIQAIATAIRVDQSLGLNPTDDGKVIRIQIPPLTEERRIEFTKIVGGKVEDTMVRLRNARHEAMKEADAAKSDKQMGEDDVNRLHKQIDEAMSKQKTEIDSLAQAKEQEIMTV